ncbi:MAG: pyruvate carboxylase subunit B [Deltaproteobacteria bacterium]|nr:pyruvate carboxylase subunit B [Deltaproteobacteria bacterium]
MARIQLTETVLRDAHQSLLATRMRTEDMVPILPVLDRVGYWSVEMWGGATFDSCLRFLNEDPWERLRTIRRLMPNTRLQMLLRGQNIVGYRHYADDLVKRFVDRTAANGLDVFRIFDAMNDIRNMTRAIECVKAAGKVAEGTLSYTVSPVHSVETFVTLARELCALGCDTICIKDMAGLLTPYAASELVAALVKAVPAPIHVHSHCTSGQAEMVYLKAAEAGASILDVAVSPMGGGTSQPPTESIIAALDGTPHATGLKLDLIEEAAAYFKEVRRKYAKFESAYTGVDSRVLQNQIPGGMISNLANQLREQDALHKMDEVLAEVPRVRAEMGYPPLVTPTSQIVGTQATLNVLSGERYKVINKETRAYFMGSYGRAPGPIDPAISQKALDGETPSPGRPADRIAPEYEKAAAEAGDLARGEEDIISYALFPQVAKKFFEARRGGTLEVPIELVAAAAAAIHFAGTAKNGGRSDDAKSARPRASAWRMAGRSGVMGSRLAGRA